MSEEPGRHRAHVGRGLAIVGTEGLETIDVLLISVDSANIGEKDRGDLLDVSGRGGRKTLAGASELGVRRRRSQLVRPARVPLRKCVSRLGKVQTRKGRTLNMPLIELLYWLNAEGAMKNDGTKCTALAPVSWPVNWVAQPWGELL